jgi:hypothetical protein
MRGVCLDVLFFVVIPCVYVHCAILSKLLPASGVWWLDAIAEDRYFVLLVPVMVPVLVAFVFVNWLGLKYFRTNE